MNHLLPLVFKGCFVLLFSLFGLHGLFGQQDSVGVFIQRDENSPFKGPNQFMWVDLKNIVTSTQIGLGEFISVHTDNGQADQPAYYSKDQCSITPEREGEVTVFAIQRIRVGQVWDTVTTVNTFFAVYQPEIRLMILYDSLRVNGRFEFFLADKYEFDRLDNTYLIAFEFEPLIFNQDNQLIGKLPKSKSSQLEYDIDSLPFVLVKGYRIVIQIMVRDMQTDLLVPADEWVHIVE